MKAAEEKPEAEIEYNLSDYFRLLGRLENGTHGLNPNILLYRTGIPHPIMNGVFCVRPVLDQEAKDALLLLDSLEVPYLWWVGRTSPSPQWIQQAAGRGLVRSGRLTGMALDLSHVVRRKTPVGLTVEPIQDEAGLADWVRVAFSVYGVAKEYEDDGLNFFSAFELSSALRFYVGYVNGEPIATAQLFCSNTSAGIYWVSTVPEARRKGIGSAVTAAALSHAQALGCHVAVLHSSSAGTGVYQKLGFRQHFGIDLYGASKSSMVKAT